MKTDIQIAREARMEPIEEIASQIGIGRDDLELYGKYKAKLNPSLWDKIKNKKDGKLILVTAMSPTPAGEGKTTTSVGLAQAFWKLGKKAVLALREPSLGPCMGIKGGAAGGGYSQVVPMEDINLHFTGDIHAITSANNLLASLIDNHIFHGNALEIDPRQVLWKRCLDLNDRELRQIVVGLGGKTQGVPREDGFNITVASEVMAVLCLSRDLEDLKERLGKMVVAYSYSGRPVFAKDLKAQGSMATLLKEAVKPNLVQTLEKTPAIVHGGPFANIAHGCNSLTATRYGLKLGDYLVTEAGFGADLGAEKFFDIKCRAGKLKPEAAVLVATIRSLKHNGGESLENLKKENLSALRSGMVNLEKHLENISLFGVPVVLALNIFPTDTKKEIGMVLDFCRKKKIPASLSRVFEAGGEGGIDLARKVLGVLEQKKSRFRFLYDQKKGVREKIEIIARKIYGAGSVSFSEKANRQMEKLSSDGFSGLPVCVAKTQYSFSDNPALLGRPKNFSLNVRELRLSAGAGFVVAVCGDIMTMPGLPKNPAAEKIDVSSEGKIEGLF